MCGQGCCHRHGIEQVESRSRLDEWNHPLCDPCIDCARADRKHYRELAFSDKLWKRCRLFFVGVRHENNLSQGHADFTENRGCESVRNSWFAFARVAPKDITRGRIKPLLSNTPEALWDDKQGKFIVHARFTVVRTRPAIESSKLTDRGQTYGARHPVVVQRFR